MSGNETLACFVVSGRRTASGGFVKSLPAKLCWRLGLVWAAPPGVRSARERDGGGGGGGGGGKGRENAKTRKGEQSTESGHAITVVRCYGAQALSRWSKKHNHWLTPPPNPSPFFPLSFSPSPLFPYILFLPTPPDFRLSFPLFLSYLIFLTDLCCGLGAGY